MALWYDEGRPMTVPPGPRDWTGGFRILPRIKRDILGFYQEMQRTYGDCVYMRLGPYRDFSFFHPDQIKEVLVTKAKSFQRMPWQRKVLAQWDGNGLVLSEGDFWLRQRRLVQPAFHHQRSAGYSRQMVAQTEKLAMHWAGLSSSPPRGGPGRGLDPTSASPPTQPSPLKGEGFEVRIDEEMTDLTLAIITSVFFGGDASAQARELAQAVAVLSDVAVREFQNLITPPRWLPLPSVRRKWAATRALDQFIRGVIKQRRAEGNPDQGDLLSMLLLAVDEEGDRGRMTDEQARDEAMVLFIAGHDTTAAALTFVWHALAERPEVQERLRADLQRELGDQPATPADLPRVPYLRQVIKETLRLYPPAAGVFTRYAVERVEIGGYPLRRRSLVRIFTYVTQRDPRWFPEPERFDPERWTPEREAQRPQYSWFPFGGGPRVCIGKEFALMEMGLIIATLLRRFEVRPAPGQGPIELQVHLSLRPKGGLRLAVRPASG